MRERGSNQGVQQKKAAPLDPLRTDMHRRGGGVGEWITGDVRDTNLQDFQMFRLSCGRRYKGLGGEMDTREVWDRGPCIYPI